MVQGSYQHTQTSYLFLPIFVALAAILFVIAWTTIEPLWLSVLFFVLAALMFSIGFVFSSLTVRVDEHSLKWHFGFNFWTKSIARSDVAKAETQKTKWWHGWGIRLTPKGWLYNVAGFDAVAVTTLQGKTVLIGTDEPEALVAALGF